MSREPLEIADDTEQQIAGLAIMNDLHRHGFTSVWLDSVMMFSGGLSEPGRPPQVQHHFIRVIIDSTDIAPRELRIICDVAERHNAELAIVDLRMNQQQFSRLSIWPPASRTEEPA